MKRNIISSGLLLCAMALLSACGGDDNPENVDFINQDVAGTYDGTLDITMAGQSEPVASDVPKEIVIAKVGEGTVSLALNNFSLTIGGVPLALGNIVVSNCAVAQSGDTYTVKGEETLTLAMVGECPTKVDGTIKDGKLDLTINVSTTYPMPMEVGVAYTGTKK